MKSFKNTMQFTSQTAKKYLAVMAVASLASFTSLASLAVFAQAADAVPHHEFHGDADGKHRDGKPGWDKDHSRFGAKLDLTDAQKASLKAARVANQASQKELHEKLRSAHEALDKASAVNADDAMLNKLTGDLASLIAQRELAHAKARRNFLNLLTPEQKQKLDAVATEAKKSPRGPRSKHQYQGPYKDQYKAPTAK